MITYKMHLLRSGKTSESPGMRYTGRADVPLCGAGVRELNDMAAGRGYPEAEMVFTSPLRRCVQTGYILYPGVYMEQHDGLSDMGLGEFEGKSFEELRGNRDFALWLQDSLENPPPGGEDLPGFTARVVNAARDIFMRMMDERISSAAVVTHGGVIMTLLAAIGQPRLPLHEWAVENGSGYTLIFTPQMWMRDGSAEVFCRLPQG